MFFPPPPPPSQSSQPREHDHGCKVMPRLPLHWKVEAEFGGENNCYRYYLEHTWSVGPLMLFAMMNPSGADMHVGDNTVMKTARIAQFHRCGGQIIVNACALRAVRPDVLRTHPDPVGPGNAAAIERARERADFLVAAHGRLPVGLEYTAVNMVRLLRASGKPVYILGWAPKTFQPLHPLARGSQHVPINGGLMLWDL